MQNLLSPKTLARAIGVSESSLKRWADEGLLAVSRTAGGHRRIELREALRYIRKERLPVLKPELLGLPELDAAPASTDDLAADQALVAAIIAGQADVARGIFLSQYLAGKSVAELCDGPLTTALRDVGDLWRHGPEGIFIEHRAVDLCAQCLHHLRSILPPAAGRKARGENAAAPRAVGGAIEGDPYAIPTLMVAAVLDAAEWGAVNLGPNLPTAALRAAVEEHRPQLVWLASSCTEAAEARASEVNKLVHDLARREIQVVVGGRGWPAGLPASDAGLMRAGSMAELAAFVKGLEVSRK